MLGHACILLGWQWKFEWQWRQISSNNMHSRITLGTRECVRCRSQEKGRFEHSEEGAGHRTFCVPSDFRFVRQCQSWNGEKEISISLDFPFSSEWRLTRACMRVSMGIMHIIAAYEWLLRVQKLATVVSRVRVCVCVCARCADIRICLYERNKRTQDRWWRSWWWWCDETESLLKMLLCSEDECRPKLYYK